MPSFSTSTMDTIFKAPTSPRVVVGSRNSTSLELTLLCSKNCVYWSTLSLSMPPPLWRPLW